jgi:hypothetical protein
VQFDLTRPNTGRTIDYWLGGTHNFEIDRQFADQVSRQYPLARQMVEDNRALVKRAVPFFYAHGLRAFIDFGASLPTCENTHLVAHALDPNIKVVYSDIDPITVAYAQELLSGDPNAIYLQCDAASPHEVLDSPLTRRLLGDERRIGFIFLGLAHLLTDDKLRATWRELYDWAASGSYMIVSAPSEHWDTDPALSAIRDSYRRANIHSTFRTPAQFKEIMPLWQLTEEGIRANARWGLPPTEDVPSVNSYSMMLYK